MLPILKREDSLKLRKMKNVVGTGVGYKVKDGVKLKEPSIICTVEKKVGNFKLRKKDRIPKEVDGVPTDVIRGDKLIAFNLPLAPLETIKTDFPAQPGASIGHVDISAGTFGFLPFSDGKPVIHSNNHVMANCNDALMGDSILYPGPYDGGALPKNHVGNLLDFEPMKYAGPGSIVDEYCKIAGAVAWLPNFMARMVGSTTRLSPVNIYEGEMDPTPFPPNYMDGAIAEPLRPDIVNPFILNIGVPIDFLEAELDMPIRKNGRTSDYTEGTISQLQFTGTVGYGDGRNALVEDQIVVNHVAGPFGQPGDSGSAVLTMDGLYVVGVLFAGSEQMTMLNRVQYHVDRFNLTL